MESASNSPSVKSLDGANSPLAIDEVGSVMKMSDLTITPMTPAVPLATTTPATSAPATFEPATSAPAASMPETTSPATSAPAATTAPTKSALSKLAPATSALAKLAQATSRFAKLAPATSAPGALASRTQTSASVGLRHKFAKSATPRAARAVASTGKFPTNRTKTAMANNGSSSNSNSHGSMRTSRLPLVHVGNNATSNPASVAAMNKRRKSPIRLVRLINTTGTDRLNREFRDVRCAGMHQIRELKLCENNILHWKFMLLPDMAPYNNSAFKAEIKFPTSYPLDGPIIHVHNIYHPNIDEKGFVCLHCLTHWSRTTRVEDVLRKLFALIRDPEPHHPMRFDVADEYLKDRKVFNHKAFEAAKTLGLPRPRLNNK